MTRPATAAPAPAMAATAQRQQEGQRGCDRQHAPPQPSPHDGRAADDAQGLGDDAAQRQEGDADGRHRHREEHERAQGR